MSTHQVTPQVTPEVTPQVTPQVASRLRELSHRELVDLVQLEDEPQLVAAVGKELRRRSQLRALFDSMRHDFRLTPEQHNAFPNGRY